MTKVEFDRLESILSKRQIDTNEKIELLTAYKKHIDKNAVFCLKCQSSVQMLVTRLRLLLKTVPKGELL